MEVLMFLGVISIPICIVIFITSDIRKNKKVKKWTSGLIACIILFALGGCNSTNQENDEKAAIEAFGKERGIDNFELAKDAYNAQKERERVIASAKEYDYNDLLKSAEGTLKGKSVHISGEITFIKESTNLAGNIDATTLLIKTNSGDVYGAYYRNVALDCKKGDYIDIYGRVEGYAKTTNGFGGESEVPDIHIVSYSVQ